MNYQPSSAHKRSLTFMANTIHDSFFNLQSRKKGLAGIVFHQKDKQTTTILNPYYIEH